MSHDKIQRLIDSLTRSPQDAERLKSALYTIRCDPELFQSFIEAEPEFLWTDPTQPGSYAGYLEPTEPEAHNTLQSYAMEPDSAHEQESLDTTLTLSKNMEAKDTVSLTDFKGDPTAYLTPKLSLSSVRGETSTLVENPSLGRYEDLGSLGRGGMGEPGGRGGWVPVG